jgi:hypothetical protein
LRRDIEDQLEKEKEEWKRDEEEHQMECNDWMDIIKGKKSEL